MIKYATYIMVFLGSALMVYNIYGFISFSRSLRVKRGLGRHNKALYIPVILLILFLAGYIAVGFFGKADIIVSGILLGGSVFVFVMYKFLTHITNMIAEGEHVRAELFAAEESSRAKDEFLASVSHEMRTPLNVIIGLDTVALSDNDLSPENRHRLEKIGGSAKYLLNLINSILEQNYDEVHKILSHGEPFLNEDSAPEPEPEEVTLEGKRVLIVDDIPENAEIVADLLELEGVESDQAENGQVGLEMFSASPVGYYDAVLMDLMMPVMDGHTAAREIRQLERADAATVPIIALSANAFEADIRRSLDAGMNAHLAKPADAELLYTTLRKYIGKA